MTRHGKATFALSLVLLACVPPGNSTPTDSGAPVPTAPPPKPPENLLTTVFEDDFERAMVQAPLAAGTLEDAGLLSPPDARAPDAALVGDGAPPKAGPTEAGLADALAAPNAPLVFERDGGRKKPIDLSPPSTLGPNWTQARTTAWRIENGRLCGQGAQNHGVWLNKSIPTNARIEFDAISDSPEGDLKAEFWGDGQSAATTISYTNATSYLAILGGWKNTYHVLARMNEHAPDRKEIVIDKTSDDPRQKPVNRGQIYRFKVERADGKTVKWSVDGIEYLSWVDKEPLAGPGHDHFGFNDWAVKVCFDNVRVTPLP